MNRLYSSGLGIYSGSRLEYREFIGKGMLWLKEAYRIHTERSVLVYTTSLHRHSKNERRVGITFLGLTNSFLSPDQICQYQLDRDKLGFISRWMVNILWGNLANEKRHGSLAPALKFIPALVLSL